MGSPHERIRFDFRRRAHAWLLSRRNSAYEEMIAERKRTLFRDIGGMIVEIGPGGGRNLAYYPKSARCIGMEANPHFRRYFARAAAELGISAEFRTGTAERIDLATASVDAVVSTLVLCSVPDVGVVLREIQRVLRPGGRFYFVEHVAAAPGSGTARLQRAIRPLWALIADGCHPDRPTWKYIEEAGFAKVECEHFRVPAPVVGPHIIGIATSKSQAHGNVVTPQTAHDGP